MAPTKTMPPGHVRGFDVRSESSSGHTIPKKANFVDTWEDIPEILVTLTSGRESVRIQS